MIELERPVGAEGGCLDLQPLGVYPQVGPRCPISLLHGNTMLLQVTSDELLSDLAPIRVPEHPIPDQRRVEPDVFWRVLPDDLHQKIDGVHSGRSQMPLDAPRFQNTRKYE